MSCSSFSLLEDAAENMKQKAVATAEHTDKSEEKWSLAATGKGLLVGKTSITQMITQMCDAVCEIPWLRLLKNLGRNRIPVMLHPHLHPLGQDSPQLVQDNTVCLEGSSPLRGSTQGSAGCVSTTILLQGFCRGMEL